MPNQDYGRGGTLDKYEYKIRAEEIKTLISQKKYVDAAKVADTIDWTRVKSVMMLCTVSDLYKVNRRFEDAKLLLEMANERHPAGRMIIYSLCDLSIKMGEVVQAVEYYKDTDDEIQWLPICAIPQTIIANKTLFDQYGIKVPENYEEYV